MNNKLFLTKLIKKAIKNGWKNNGCWFRQDNGEIVSDLITDGYLYRIIFSHEFAKAIWNGTERCWSCKEHGLKKMYTPDNCNKKHFCDECGEELVIGNFDKPENWQYHIQRLALSEDRIKYLKENVNLDNSRNLK